MTLDGITVRLFRKAAKENYISVLDIYGEDAVVNIFLYTRNGQNHHVTADTIFSNKDVLIAFGPYESVRTVFGELKN